MLGACAGVRRVIERVHVSLPVVRDGHFVNAGRALRRRGIVDVGISRGGAMV